MPSESKSLSAPSRAGRQLVDLNDIDIIGVLQKFESKKRLKRNRPFLTNVMMQAVLLYHESISNTTNRPRLTDGARHGYN